MAIKLIEVGMELGRFFLINWKVMALYVYIDKNALTKGQMASQSKSEMTGLPGQFFNIFWLSLSMWAKLMAHAQKDKWPPKVNQRWHVY